MWEKMVTTVGAFVFSSNTAALHAIIQLNLIVSLQQVQMCDSPVQNLFRWLPVKHARDFKIL